MPPLGLEAAVEAGLSRAGSFTDSPRWAGSPRGSIDFGTSAAWHQQQQAEQPWLGRLLSKQVRRIMPCFPRVVCSWWVLYCAGMKGGGLCGIGRLLYVAWNQTVWQVLHTIPAAATAVVVMVAAGVAPDQGRHNKCSIIAQACQQP